MTDKILIVDDEAYILEILQDALSQVGFPCDTATDGFQAMSLLERDTFALLLADIRMPKMDGLELVKRAKAIDSDLAVIMVTAVDEIERAITAMKLGAYDYLVKPFNLDEVLMSIQKALDKRRLAIENREYKEGLERKVEKRTKELAKRNQQLRQLFLTSIETLALTLEAKDEYTQNHSRRVAEYAVRVAEELGLPASEQEHLRIAGLIHDIGKIGVADKVLHKQGRYTEEEYEQMKAHPEIARRILEPMELMNGFERALLYVQHHQERYDGSGYPDGLKGEDIPLGARILAVCDAYDAMTSDRPYRTQLTQKVAADELKKYAGTQFDPNVVFAFLECLKKECIITYCLII